MAITDRSGGRICSPYRTCDYWLVFSIFRIDFDCATSSRHLALVYLVGISSSKRPFGISFSFDVFSRVSRLSPFKVSVFNIIFVNIVKLKWSMNFTVRLYLCHLGFTRFLDVPDPHNFQEILD